MRSPQSGQAQDIRETETADPEHPLCAREDPQIPREPPFSGATKVGKPRAEIDKASQADPPRGVADARKEIAGQVGSGD